MCRLAAFPPFFSKKLAYDILKRMEGSNKDGTGSVYVKDGQFIVNKLPVPLDEAIVKIPLLDHMPYDGWTVVHMRAATHGGNEVCNTHPFIKGSWAVVHNGVWSDNKVLKAGLPDIKWEGETDSEVAAHLLNVAGPEKFCDVVSGGGVFLALNQSGLLLAIKTSGQLEVAPDGRENSNVVASDLAFEWKPKQQDYGWLVFDEKGAVLFRKQREWLGSYGNYSGHGRSYYSGNCSGGGHDSYNSNQGRRGNKRSHKRERQEQQRMLIARIVGDSEDAAKNEAIKEFIMKDGEFFDDEDTDKFELLDGYSMGELGGMD